MSGGGAGRKPGRGWTAPPGGVPYDRDNPKMRPCPTCEARPGERCVSIRRNAEHVRISKPHKER